MSYSIIDVQQALQAKLTATVALQSLLGSPMRIYDHAPPHTAYPYVIYGNQSAQAFDTKDTTGLEIALTLHIYSRLRGRQELRQVEAAIYSALHNQPLTVSGANFCQCRFVRSAQALESDGITYRARIDLRITITD